jgi:hypothetical protein
MTNAYGYYLGMREEIIDTIDEIYVDPNRDFPILKRTNECMKTISARTINEIFINNLIRMSISIHGGTSSLTYAYGTPNHLINLNQKYKLPLKLKDNMNYEVLENYYSGRLDHTNNESTEAPDNQILESKI